MAYKCPHCEEEISIPEEGVALRNTENYGSCIVKSMCPKCDKPIKLGIVREAIITSVYKGTHKSNETSF